MQTETIRLNVPKPSYIKTNGIELHVMQAGVEDGPPVLMLHGFPEFWYGWHDYFTPLAEAGYRVIVPDQRGYNLSDKPDGLDAYTLETLVADMIGLLDALGHEQVRLVGHDWGGVVAWKLAEWYPERIQQLMIANMPHQDVFREHLRNSPKQLLKSWYVNFFQIPLLPEWSVKFNNWQVPSRIIADIPGMTEREVRLYQQAWAQPGAFNAMLNWYRAILQKGFTPPVESDGRVHVPTLLVWGKQDNFLSHEMAQPSIEKCDDGHLIFFEDASHFIQHEKSVEIRDLMLAYFKDGLDATRDS